MPSATPRPGDRPSRQRFGAEIKTKKQQVCQAGDFLVAEIDAKVGGFGIVPDDLAGAIVSSHYFLFEVDEERLNRCFFDYFIRTPDFRDQVTAQGSTNYAAIRPNDVLGYEIPLPPLAEQRRIVARIEELAVRINEARAFRHKATQESDALMGAALREKFLAFEKVYPVKTLQELTSHIIDGPHVTPHYLANGVTGIPFVTVKNMVTGKLSFDNLNYISEDDHRQFTTRCKAEYGDVLYSKDGATRGCRCFMDTTKEFSFFVSVALIKPLRDRLDGRYLVHLLNSNWIKDLVVDKSRGDMIPHISFLGKYERYLFPFPHCPTNTRL